MIDDPERIHLFCFLSASALTYLCVHPVIAFARRGWFVKQEDVTSSLSSDAKRVYLNTFMNGCVSIEDAEDKFDKLYKERFGRGRLIVPIVFLCLMMWPLMWLLSETGLGHIVTAPKGTLTFLRVIEREEMVTLPAAAAAAIAGAYTWIVLALIGAAATANLPPGTILAGAMRIAMAAPLGYAIAAFGPKGLGPPLAFAIGAFPLDQVQSALRQLAAKNLNLQLDQSAVDQVIVLDGVDRSTADRLSQADVSTVAQFAYCDPVQVSMKTNINFDAVIDGQNQALLRIYLGDLSSAVRPMGIRGALEAHSLYHDLNGYFVVADLAPSPTPGLPTVDPGPQALSTKSPQREAQAAFFAMVRATKINSGGLYRMLREVSADPYTKFLESVCKPDPGDPAH